MRIRVLLVVLVFACASFLPIHASTILYFNSNTVKEVDGLVVDGQTYNVTFVGATAEGTFQGNATGASHAAFALDTALNSASPIALRVALLGTTPTYNFVVPFIGLDGWLIEQNGAGWMNVGGAYLSDTAAQFAPVSANIPEPSSFALLATGVIGVTSIFRRRLLKGEAGPRGARMGHPA